MMIKNLILCLFLLSGAAFADTKPAPIPGHAGSLFDFPIRKGAMIAIESYDPKSDTYKVRMTKEEAVGPNVTTLEYLEKAVKTLPEKNELQRNPGKIVGNEYKLDDQLTLLFPEGVAKRQKLLKSH